ncbi:MAG: terminase small subunit [Pseudomonadota bacterium]
MSMIGAPGLSNKQREFVREYVVDNNGTKAAQRAGYSPDNPRAAAVSARRLLKTDKIQDALELERKRLNDETGITVEWVLQRLQLEAKGAAGDSNQSGRVRALEAIGKHLRMFVERTEDVTPGGRQPIEVSVVARPIPENHPGADATRH